MAYPKRSIISLGMGVPGWICLVFLLIGLVFGTVASFQIAKGWRLQTAGVEVRGHVKSLTLRTHSCGKDNMDTCTSYDVSYFFDAGGKGQEAQALVAASFYAGLSEGLALPVRYVEDDPTISEIEPGTTMIAAVAFGVFALGFVGGGGGALALRMRNAGQTVRLRETGTLRQAVVTSRDETNVRINGTQQWVIQWRDASGAIGKSRMQRQEDLPQQGSSIAIYAAPEGKLPPVWEGDSGSR